MIRVLLCIEAEVSDDLESPREIVKYIHEHSSSILSIGTKEVKRTTYVLMTDKSPSWGFRIEK
jgi:hypothetical protein